MFSAALHALTTTADTLSQGARALVRLLLLLPIGCLA